ncbi:MAG: MerC domain-containing protein [Methylophaga sp.]
MKDKLAIVVSGTCLIHCILTPLVIGFGAMGMMGQWLGSEWIHKVLLIPVVGLALLSLPRSYRCHRKHWPLVMAMLAIATLLSTLVLPESLELLLSVPAALTLIMAHSWNHFLMRQFKSVAGGGAANG